MRFLIAAILLTACAQEQPQARIDAPPHLSELTYSCSEDGYEVVRFTLEDGFEEGITGRRCDPATFDVHQSRRSELMMTYDEWLRRNRPET